MEPFQVPPPQPAFVPPPLPPPRPPVRSADGRVALTDDELTVEGRHYALLELERVSVKRVRWLLWILLGGIVLAWFILGFLQNWLRTPTAMLGMTAGALLLAWGQRGTNRLRLHLLGREATHHALAGDTADWQKLAAEINQRIHLRHQRAAAEALALLHATEAPDQLGKPESSDSAY